MDPKNAINYLNEPWGEIRPGDNDHHGINLAQSTMSSSSASVTTHSELSDLRVELSGPSSSTSSIAKNESPDVGYQSCRGKGQATVFSDESNRNASQPSDAMMVFATLDPAPPLFDCPVAKSDSPITSMTCARAEATNTKLETGDNFKVSQDDVMKTLLTSTDALQNLKHILWHRCSQCACSFPITGKLK